MARASGPGLRSRLVALVVLGTLPAVAVLIHGALATRDAAIENGRVEAVLRARSVADGQLRVLDGTALVLRALADSEVIRSGTPEQCADFLGGFLRQNRTYANLGIVREDGSFRASVLPIPPGVTATDRSWFREVRESDAFSVGEFQVGRVTGRPSINAAVPLRLPGGRREYLFAAIDLAHLQEIAASVALPPGGVLEIFDRTGTLLVRLPPAPSEVGTRPAVAPAIPGTGEGGPRTVVEELPSGERRIVAYEPLLAAGGRAAAHLRVGIPEATVVAEASGILARGLLLTAAVAGIAVAAALAFGHFLVLRPVRRLEEVSARIGAGDLAARSGPPYSKGELGGLERSVDAMAAALEQERTARHAVATDLRGREERFREMAAIISETFWVASPGRRSFAYVSPAFERVWGIPAERLYLEPGLWIEAIHPSDRERVARLILRGGDGEFDESYRVLRPDGSVRWVRDRAFPATDEAGNVVRVFGIAEDVTGLRDLEFQIQQSQKMEAMGRLAAGVAHDFNNMLTVIQGYSQIVAGTLDGERRQQLQEVQRASDQAAILTRQLLTFSRRQPVAPVAVDLNAVLSEMDRMIRRLIGSAIEVVALPGASLRAIHADPNQIQQVILNIVVNARDAMPHGGRLTLETYEVLVDAAYAESHLQAKPGPYVVLAISDSGIGMDDAVKERIFDPFFTTKGEGKGTGLGLSTVYGIVRACGGDIFVYSEKDRGSTFKVYFPPHDAPAAARPSARAAAAGAATPRTILLVEDDDAIRRLLFSSLRAAGHSVIAAASAEDALRELQGHEGPLDLLVTDVGLPGMDGLALAGKVRQRRPRVRVLLISGYTEATAAGRGDLPRWADYVSKPFTPPDLLAKIAAMSPPGGGAESAPVPSSPVSECRHLSCRRLGVQESPVEPFRLHLMLCEHCGTTVSTERLRVERR
jgi:PAS domain S-box-containing protein